MLLRMSRALGYLYLILEIIVFIAFISAFGFLTTLVLFILTTVLGVAVLRQHSFEVMNTLQQWSQSGRPDIDPTWGSPLMVLGGILLILPGFITDLFGIGFVLLAWLRPQTTLFNASSASSRSHGKTIEGEYTHTGASNDTSELPKPSQHVTPSEGNKPTEEDK